MTQTGEHPTRGNLDFRFGNERPKRPCVRSRVVVPGGTHMPGRENPRSGGVLRDEIASLGGIERDARAHGCRDSALEDIAALGRRRLQTKDLLLGGGVVFNELLSRERRLADDEGEVPVLVHPELDAAALDVGNGLSHVHRHGTGAGIGHEAAGAQDATQAADLAHEVGGGHGGVEVRVTLGDFLDELVATDLVRAGGEGLLGPLALGKDDDAGGLTGTVRQGHGATDHLVRLAGVDAQAEDDIHGGVELGNGGGLGQVNGLGRGVEDSGLDLLSRGAVGLGALGHLLLLAVVVFGPREALPRFRMGVELRGPADRRVPQASTVMPMERAVPAMILAAASTSLALRSGILDSAISRT